MSEFPILPGLEAASGTPSNPSQDHIVETDRMLADWEHGFDAENRIILERDDSQRSPEWWSDSRKDGEYSSAPEYVHQPQTNLDVIVEQLKGAEDAQLRTIIQAHTESINQLRSLYQ